MEPQIIDYYNNMPSGINVIDKMNEELDDLQKKYDELEKKYDKIKEFPRPRIRVKTIDEIKIYSKKIEDSIPLFREIIYDFLNHRGWILEYDKPSEWGSYAGNPSVIGHWWTWETDNLKWGDTTAHKFYDTHEGNCYYNLYLKCKLLEELYKLFPEYTERKKGWFHQQIDSSFTEVDNFLNIVFSINDQFYELFINNEKIKDTVVRVIMEKLFGLHIDHVDHIIIPNIIYYKCCDYKIFGEEFTSDYDYEGPGWYKETNERSHLDKDFCECSFKCPGCGKSII